MPSGCLTAKVCGSCILSMLPLCCHCTKFITCRSPNVSYPWIGGLYFGSICTKFVPMFSAFDNKMTLLRMWNRRHDISWSKDDPVYRCVNETPGIIGFKVLNVTFCENIDLKLLYVVFKICANQLFASRQRHSSWPRLILCTRERTDVIPNMWELVN